MCVHIFPSTCLSTVFLFLNPLFYLVSFPFLSTLPLTHSLPLFLRGFGKADTLTGVAFWPAIRPLLSNEEKERFSRLRFINTDIGRGRAWLRGSINERTLENYMQTLLVDRGHLK